MTADTFNQPLSRSDPLVATALNGEARRQENQLELIASENIVSRGVLDALGHQITNKTLEGYPGRRFHGGGEFVDVVEQAAIDRAGKLFNCAYVNVQPHSGTQANQAVFFALIKPGDSILSLALTAGGHLSHGARPNLSGRWFAAEQYNVVPGTSLIDYDALAQQALEVQPALLIAGGSAYPREIDFARMRVIADSVKALLLVDMAHFAGLVAAGVHPSPLPHADIVTCTTTKTLRGPRGGLILSNSLKWRAKLQPAVFPGVQGSLHSQIIAAKAVCLGEALAPEFKDYGRRVKANAARLAKTLMARGIAVVSGGTDTHLVLLDLSANGINGQQAQNILAAANITSNKNPIPYDHPKPSEWVGLRLGVGALTTRGLDTTDVAAVGEMIADLIEAESTGRTKLVISRVMEQVALLCRHHPIYS